MTDAAVSADVIVVGSGAGGGAAAYRLAAKGLSVLVLERGRSFTPWRDYPVHIPNGRWNDAPFYAHLALEREAPEELDPSLPHLLSWNKLSGRADPARRPDFTVMRCFGVGGSTLAYQGEAHRFSESSFRLRSESGAGEDWPLSYADLEPYYEEVEELLAVAGGEAPPGRPRRAPFPQPPHLLSPASRLIADGCRRLGLKLLPNPVAILSRPHRGRPPCVGCGRCDTGCHVGAKSSSDVALIARAVATGKCRVLSECRALEIEVDARGRASGVLFKDGTGRARSAKSSAVVLAAGSAETPRLLLHSGGARSPHGLANSSGWVGRGLMDNVHAMVGGYFDRDLSPLGGIPIDARIWEEGPFPKPGREDPGGCVFGVSNIMSFLPNPLAYSLRFAAPWGHAHHDDLRRYYGRVVGVFGVAEKLPDGANRLELHPDKKDEDGYPSLRVASRASARDARVIDSMRLTCRAILEAAGASEIVLESSSYDMGGGGTHVVGTCRMGRDPARSVVDPFGRCHDVPNLFIADGSVFVTQGGGDSPSLTIQALALRAADRLAESAARGDL